MRICFGLAFAMLLVFGFHPVARGEGSARAAYQRVKPTMIHVWAYGANGVVKNSGTAIVLSSTDRETYALTAQHVIADAASLSGETIAETRQVPIHVIAESKASSDLAVVKLDRGGLAPIRFSPEHVSEGDVVAVAGYAGDSATQSTAGGGEGTPRLIASVTVSSLTQNQRLLELSNVKIEKGMSGGPVFDGDGQLVAMIVTKGNTPTGFAVSALDFITTFLTTNHVAYASNAQPSPQRIAERAQTAVRAANARTAFLRALPGAGRLAVFASNTAELSGFERNAAQRFDTTVATQLSAQFGTRTVLVQAPTAGSLASSIDAARKNGALTFATSAITLRNLGASTDVRGGPTNIVRVTVQMNVVDTFGETWLGAEERADIAYTTRNAQDATESYYAQLGDLASRAIATMRKQIEFSHPESTDSRIANLFRYAIPLANGERGTLVNTRPVKQGIALDISPVSSGAEAGLQSGDIAVAINGTNVIGISNADLGKLRDDNPAGNDFEIIESDGSHVHIRVLPRDLRWFVERRAALAPS